MKRVLVVGTGTEVGKTWAGAAVLDAWRAQGRRVAARKPAQSFAEDEGEGPTDAEVLAAATGESPHDVCPPHRWYPVPMAPFMAAEVLGLPPFTLADLAAEIRWPDGVDLGLVETAGGVRSPIASDGGDSADLAALLEPDAVLLVADAGLGTINAVRLCLDALPAAVVLLNRFDPDDDLHRRNATWLAEHTQACIVTDVDALAAALG